MQWFMNKIIKDEKIDMAVMIEKYGQDIPLLKELEKTDQDPEWHAEGNVFIHTNMVIEEMYKIFDENNFSIEDKYILLMSVVFHDIAKPITSKWREIQGVNRLTASKHEYEGMSYLYYKFLELEVEHKYLKHILNLVGFHQMPKKLVLTESNYFPWNFQLLTEETAGYLFYYLELADMRGRETKEYDEQLEYIELFKMMTEEYDCFNTVSNIDKKIKESILSIYPNEKKESLSYIVGKAKKRWSEGDKSVPEVFYGKYYKYKDNYTKFYVLCGLSGSGKTTLVEKLKKENDNIKVVELDQIRLQYKVKRNNRRLIDGKVRQESKELIKKYLREGYDVIFDACNLRSDFREMVCDLAEEYFAKTILILSKTKKSECIKNDRERSIRTVGDIVIEKQLKSFQYPLNSEFNEIMEID